MPLKDLIATAAAEVAALHSLALETDNVHDRERLQQAIDAGLDDICQMLHRDTMLKLGFIADRAAAGAALACEHNDAARTMLYLLNTGGARG